MNRVLNAKHPFVPHDVAIQSGVGSVEKHTNSPVQAVHPMNTGQEKKLKLVMPEEEPGATSEHYVATTGDSLPAY